MKDQPYLELYNLLKKEFALCEEESNIPSLGICIKRNKMISAAKEILPGKETYKCLEHGKEFGPENDSNKNPLDTVESSILDIPDISINCNNEFNYVIVDETARQTGSKLTQVIILFHGLNEKKWDKYLPWAYKLLKHTGKPVILFPLAFHMDRAPKEWSESKLMNAAAKERAAANVLNSHTSFVNAAISSRLSSNPQRFFWSGLQSYLDVTSLMQQLYKGRINGFGKGSTADIFGYSIGAYFGLILIMAGAGGFARNSKLFAFCGGPTLDRMYPISKYILDARASSQLGSYYLEMLNNGLKGNHRLEHYLSDEHPEESFFKAMLLYHHYKDLRENRLQEAAQRIYAVALKQDEVIPPIEVMNTLMGENHNISIKVETEDFPYPYSHVNPFPIAEKYSKETDVAFLRIMKKAGEFLR